MGDAASRRTYLFRRLTPYFSGVMMGKILWFIRRRQHFTRGTNNDVVHHIASSHYPNWPSAMIPLMR